MEGKQNQHSTINGNFFEFKTLPRRRRTNFISLPSAAIFGSLNAYTTLSIFLFPSAALRLR